MFEVKIETNFSSAHHLLNYKGKCENNHGHNWKVEVTARGTELDKSNILIDFIGEKRRNEVAAWKNVLSRELCKSPVPYQLIGVSSMGNVELRRDRMRADTLSATRTVSAICYDLFKQILKTPDKIRGVQVSLEIYAALTSILKDTFERVEAKTGGSIHLSASSDVGKFRVEYI